MNDVEKTNIERQNSGKRMRRRKRMMSVYIIAVVLLVLTIGITMCFTFLFNVDEIVVSGESQTYSYMQIVEASGVRGGDNMLRLSTGKAEKQILDSLLFVETAEVDRDFPSTLRINVTRCIPAYNVQYDDGVLLVSRQGKILSDNNFYSDIENLPVIYGLEPASTEAGTALQSVNPNKYEAFSQIISRFDRDDNTQIESIDITNEYEIVVNYRNGVVFEMGNWSDVEYKLDLAQNVMNDDNIKGKKGWLKMVGSNQCSFRGNGEAETTTVTTTTGTDMMTTTSVATTTTAVTTEAVVDYNNNGYDNGYNEYGYLNGLTDEDGDGIPDQYGEYFADYDGDGYPDYPNDYNGNGIPDDQEVWMDVDGDGIPDYGYTDYDYDGIPDQWG
ncbi:MAG: FtsQ-type POTRA domain-containing protein [Ruminococcus flavefaciens]|nr:FtsQ-type POTRA domain-containing protein [Ruminococcus flavefaciens]MCM1229072.1 FtsQ-type POTRA domain-containing protein [Ruminococcus flavefaciens]